MSRRIQELDALRGLAAFAVTVHHLTFTTYKGSLLALGNTGVDLFFIISGYVIFLTINHTKSWKDFVVSRFARLYPTYWAALLFTVTLSFIFQPNRLSTYNILWNVTMVQSIGNAAQLDPSYWTLGVEIVFYFLILIIYNSGQIRRIELWGTFLMIAILSIHTVLPIIWYKIYNSLTHRIEFLNHAPFFFIGILFFNIQHKGTKIYRFVLIGLCVILQTKLHYKGYTWYDISEAQHILMICLYTFIFYLFISGNLKWIVTPTTLFFGKISYSLYLIHNYFGNNVLIPILINNNIPFFISLLLTLLICIALAIFFNYYIENPTNRLIRNWSKVLITQSGEHINTSQKSAQ